MKRISRREFVQGTAAAAGAGLISRVAGAIGGPVEAAAGLAKRPFGRHGVEVTPVGLGGGGRFFEPVPSDEAGAELVRRAIDGGILFIETAANYGPEGDGNMAERRIGMAMKTHRARVFLETKTDARDYDGAMREMERSLKLLKTDRIDLMLHHNLGRPGELDQIAADNGAEKAIRKMVDQKVVRFRGFSCHDPALTLQGIARLDPDAIQGTINATRIPDFEAEVLPLAKSKGIAVVAMKTVGHGFFLREAADGSFDSRFKTDKDPAQHRFAPPAEAFGKPHPTPQEFLQYALTLPLTVALVGLDSQATLDSVLKVASAFSPLSSARQQDIHQRAQVFASTGYWIPRSGAANGNDGHFMHGA
jgi:aryl-alcohol dehydrogenase-like predicted oxidoreductase